MARSAPRKVILQCEERNLVSVVTSKALGTGHALLQLVVTLPGVILVITRPVTLNKLLKFSVPHFACLQRRDNHYTYFTELSV